MGSWVHTGHHPFMQRNRKPGDCLPVAHMGYSSDSERPAKRLKSSEAYEYERLSDITFSPSGFSPSSNAAFQPADHTTNGIFTKAWSPPAPQSSFTSNETLDQPSSTESSPTEVPRDSFHHADNKAESNGDVDITFGEYLCFLFPVIWQVNKLPIPYGAKPSANASPSPLSAS